jgi:tetratricopeptide (TPR) repeat protein
MKSALNFFLLFFLFLSPGLKAQNQKIDSVKTILLRDGPDTLKVNHLHELAYLYASVNIDSSLFFCNEALALAEELDWKMGIGQSHYLLASFEDRKGNYPVALREYDKALKCWETLEKELSFSQEKKLVQTRKLKTLTNIGNGQSMESNFPKALNYSFAALKLAVELDNKYLQANNLGNIGSVFNRQKDYTKALEYYFRAEKIYSGLGMKNGIAYCYIGIGNSYNDMHEYNKALDYYFRALKINEETDNKLYIAANLGNIGNAYLRLDRNSEAQEYLLKALALDEETGNTMGMAYRLSSLGFLYSKEKNYKKAEEYLLKGLDLAASIGTLDLQLDSYKDLSELYSKQKNFEKSLMYYKKYSEVKDSLFNEEKNKEITRHELNYEFEKKESELKAIQDKKEAVALAEKKKQEIFFWLVIAVAIAVAIIALIIFRSLKTTRKQKRMIEAQKELVEKKQQEVLDSIHYAKRIQQSLLPSDNYVDKSLKRLKK